MSATFKNAKRKFSQSELRRLMKDHKEKEKTRKVESPLAKYNDAGQLTCILCKSIVKSDGVWPIHINSKQHREHVEQAKKLKEKTNNFTTPLKRPLTPPMEIPTKKVKGILKNSNSTSFMSTESSDINKNLNQDKIIETTEEVTDVDMESNQDSLPEGFFDDPKLDAKARNVEFKDPIEEEWERFQKEMKEADHESAIIIAEDQEEAVNERQIEEIEEQMSNWSRVLQLEQKKTSIKYSTNNNSQDSDEDSMQDDIFDEYVDWRSKTCF